MALDEGAGAGVGAGGDAGVGTGAGGDAGAAGAGAGGATAALFGGVIPGADAGGAAGAAAGGDAGGGADGGDPDWWGSLSDQVEGDSAANRDFAKSKGWKTPDDVIKSYREVERAFRENGRVKVPGEGATAEEIAAWRSATGVPESVEGYALPQIQGSNGETVSLDQSVLGKLLPKALELGMPAQPMNALMTEFVQMQLDEQAAFDKGATDAASAWVGKQGADGNAKLAAIETVANALNLSGEDLIAIRNSLAALHGPEAGVAKALDMFSRLGEGMAEDTMITGGRGRFSVSGREAQAELNQMIAKAKDDRSYAQKVQTAGTPENERWNRLQGQAAQWAERERQNA